MLRAAAAAEPTRASGWIVLRGFDDALVAERRLPRRAELDRAVPHRRLRLRHRTGHASLLNSAAFDVLGAPPRDARVEPDDEGRPVLLVGAERWLDNLTGRPSRAAVVKGLRRAEDLFRRVGINRIWDATHRDARGVAELLDLVADAGVTVDLRTMRTLEAAEEGATVKLFPQDGDLAHAVAWAHRRGAGVAIHAIDDTEVEAAISAIERHRATGLVDRIEHATLVSKPQARRIAAVGAAVVTHPGWLVTRRAKYEAQLAPAARRCLIPVRTLLQSGCRVAFASDAPVELPDPQLWLRAAMDRNDGEAIDLTDAVSAANGGGLWE